VLEPNHRRAAAYPATCAALVLLAACGGKEAAAPAPAPVAAPAPAAAPAAEPTQDPTAEAKQIFATRCTPCHGPEGKGDGPASKGLTPPPRNFSDATWQQSVTDDHIEKIIQYGGAAVGKSPAMPANPDLPSKPAVVTALRTHVRSLKQ
jgi:mono/diheme cytochrome c family protein